MLYFKRFLRFNFLLSFCFILVQTLCLAQDSASSEAYSDVEYSAAIDWRGGGRGEVRFLVKSMDDALDVAGKINELKPGTLEIDLDRQPAGSVQGVAYIQAIIENLSVEARNAIEVLSLAGNGLPDLPDVRGLVNLEIFDVSENSMISLGNLVNRVPSRLKIISFRECDLTVFPNIVGLNNLKTIYASGNQFTQLPDISHLSALEELDLGGNRLVSLPNLDNLINLKELDLSSNGLATPPNLSRLVRLQDLNLSYNNLTVPPVLTGLINLKNLDLGDNLLKSAPNLDGLINLQELDLSNNQIVVPPFLSGLSNLKSIWFTNNQLIFPPNLTGLYNLRVSEQDFSGNPFMADPKLKGLLLYQLNQIAEVQRTGVIPTIPSTSRAPQRRDDDAPAQKRARSE